MSEIRDFIDSDYIISNTWDYWLSLWNIIFALKKGRKKARETTIISHQLIDVNRLFHL